MFKILFGLFFLPSIYSLKDPYMAWEPIVSEQTVEYSNASDWQICKNKQEFSDFWTISYCFVHIVMLIIIQMHFVLLTTISLLFVWEGHFWIILKKGWCLSPQRSPPPQPAMTCGAQMRASWAANVGPIMGLHPGSTLGPAVEAQTY